MFTHSPTQEAEKSSDDESGGGEGEGEGGGGGGSAREEGKHVEFAEEATTTLSDITLEVKPGELVCVYGPTGCGKSSLLLSILGEVRRVRGTVEVSPR